MHDISGSGRTSRGFEKIRTLGANLLFVMPGARTSGGARLESGTEPTLTEEDPAAIVRERFDVQVAAPLLSRTMPLVAGNRNWRSLVAGIGNDYLVAREWQVEEGWPFTSVELASAAKVAIVGCRRSASISLFTSKLSGASDTLTAMKSSESRLVPRTAPITRLFAVDSGMNTISSWLRPAAPSPLLLSTPIIEKGTLPTRNVSPTPGRPSNSSFMINVIIFAEMRRVTLGLRIRQMFLTARSATVYILNVLLIAVASVSLVVGGISIMNIMLVSVTERTREIGLRIAVGATRSDIQVQFLIEAATLALVGGLAGAIFGAAAAIQIGWKAGWPILISPWAILLACGFSALVGIAFGLYPARRAARLDPIVSLRYE